MYPFGRYIRRLALALLIPVPIVVALTISQQLAWADIGDDIVVRPKWNHIITKPGVKVQVNLDVENNGQVSVGFSIGFIETPGPDWEVGIRGSLTNYPVLGVYLAPSDERSMPLEFKIPDTASPGDYRWVLKVVADDGSFEQVRTIVMTVEPAESDEPVRTMPGTLELSAPKYSSLSGTADSAFEFNVTLRNGTEEAVDLVLDGTAPESWILEFVPAFGSKEDQEKKITSISLEPGSSETVVVRVIPLRDESPGQYGIEFVATEGDHRLSAVLQVDIVGTINLQIGSQSGRLTADVMPGEGTSVDILVANIGNEVVSTIDLLSRPPEDWEVTFNPEGLRFVGRQEQKTVQALIMPPSDAETGDYRVSLIAHADGVTDSMDLLVTIPEQSLMGWVWAGMLTVIVVGGALLAIRLRGA